MWDRMAMWGFFSAPKHPLLYKIMEVYYDVYEQHGKTVDVPRYGNSVVFTFSGK